MAVTVIHTPEIDESKFSLSVEHGGTGARSPKKAAENLGLVAYSQVDQKNGVGLLSPENTVQRKNYPSSLVDTTLPVFFGDAAFYAGDSLVIQIANYDSSAVYSVDVSGMGNANYVINGDQITLSSKNGIPGAQVLKINGREFHFLIEVRKPNQPSLTNLSGSLVQGHVALSAEVPFEGQNFVSSAFSDFTGTLVHNYTNWELSTSLDFATIAMNSNLQADKGNWNTPAFNPDSDYFLRFRHVATNGGVSDWSMVYSFRTAKLRTIGIPSIVSPVQNAVGVAAQLTLSASAFSSVNFMGHHVSTDWQIASDDAFTNIVQSSMNDGVNLTSWQTAALSYGTVYYTRVRYRADIAASNGSPYSDWSSATIFTVMVDNRSVSTPVIVSPVNDSIDLLTTVSVDGSVFSAINYTDTHVDTDWEISTDLAFTNPEKVHGDSLNKTSKVYSGLAYGVKYYVRMRYRGTVKVSDWSTVVSFTTKDILVVNIVIAADTLNFNIRDALIGSYGWDQVLPVDVTVTINSGVYVGSNAVSTDAFETGSGYPTGSKLRLINNSYILGAGGTGEQGSQTPNSYNVVWYGGGTPGGPALKASYPLTVDNYGTIGGGGGGGGAGSSGFTVYYPDESGLPSTTTVTGGPGGGGAGYRVGSGGARALANGYPASGYGSDASYLYGGAGLSTGGKGGDLGQYGAPGVSAGGVHGPTGGHAPGNAVTGNSFITWISTGTRLGPIV